ncbi:hypothetical protein CKM354_000027400 [Cercospora kikuchii]|uniref:Peptidase M43 pregnancy-associated plasma-A domain-containing protein n=1 Tax=Cercospora kikuchii TaxID=84275 RepID=A0A9P3C507_9PEZI|nr:uncharacterized protein CKM354_000027400 [Cercospora kikuchii]GIZ36807.1 hypothetical protein CKM354_000027400 [Cercospora kikuchii]
MRGFTFATLATLLSLAFAANKPDANGISTFVDPVTNQTIRRFDCGTTRAKASTHFNETIRFLARNGRRPTGVSRLFKRAAVTPAITVNTYLHLLTTTANAGTLTTEMANAQVAALNKAYNPIGITFNLINVSTTVNDAWAIADGNDMDDAKKSLRSGKYRDLNLYFHSDFAGGILGTCTLPSLVTAQTRVDQYYSDGCNINAATMPGGSMDGYNMGMTAVHETGHWLGLLHTFEGYSCEGEGDLISDTPAQSTSTDGCPVKPPKDSCPTKTGVDAIHNYMDYSSDECYSQFTPGQVSRIQTLWQTYREGF